VELIVNGSFTKGLYGWEIRGIVYAGVGAELYARARIPAGIAQTVEGSNLSPDLTFSYKVTTVFHSYAGFPFLTVSVVAYVLNQATMEETAITLYSKKYEVSPTSTTESYDVTVNLKEKLLQESKLPLRRIRVAFEAGFEDIHVLMQSQVYVHYVSLLIASSPPPPPMTTTLTVTITSTEALTVTHTIRQQVTAVAVELLFLTALVVGSIAAVAAYGYSKRRAPRS